MSYEGGVRVPFIIYWKKHIAKGLSLTSSISNVDILPTFAHFAHATLPSGRDLDGQDISDLLTGKADPRTFVHRPIFIVNHGKPEAVRWGHWKYRVADGATELFNLGYDPSERTNVLAEFPEEARKGKELFDAWNANIPN